jgi:hypothetical protein
MRPTMAYSDEYFGSGGFLDFSHVARFGRQAAHCPPKRSRFGTLAIPYIGGAVRSLARFLRSLTFVGAFAGN